MEQTPTVQFVKGIGPKRAQLLARLGITTPSDLLYYFPRDWSDRRTDSLLSLFRQNTHAVMKGKILFLREIPTRKQLTIMRAVCLNSQNREFEALWFKRTAGLRYDPFEPLKRELAPGREFWFIGRLEDEKAATPVISVEEYYADDDQRARAVHICRLAPVYGLTEGLSSKLLREMVYAALQSPAAKEPEFMPSSLMRKRELLGLEQALRGVHFPNSMAELEAARRRIVYQEFLLLSAAWTIKKRQTRTELKNYSYEIRRTLLTPFREKMGFEFTHAQVRVINEIFRDMRSRHPMTRLLQGDVGSGKTVAALSALLLAAENGWQGAFMAPTEILAEQHFMTLSRFLTGLPVKFELLTSRTTAAARRGILARLAGGETQLLVGTHAIIENDVKFKNLRLAVIDEQHRFGVEQRALLRGKTGIMDLLVMTATPIPRTLALAFYGDLDVSVIDELPPGRKPVITSALGEAQAFEILRGEIRKGRQAYIVHPLIEESKTLELKAVTEEYERLSKDVFREFRLGMLHGQMKGREKTAVMEKFLNREIDILVATPVIEVGIDVKNATVMLIQNAERFGLASLHQLRGRVGRGSEESVCLLVPSASTDDAAERISIMCETGDGFKIGEQDMKMRGPGTVLGTRQHGESDLKAGDVFRDREVLESAILDRDELFTADPNLVRPEHFAFRKKLTELYAKRWHLIDLS
ncbi:MAG: ATP-dependent DNA helicase RecG [Elusimicrobiaceae bacterium]|nr:ATP-dependent DNA helicase RecG [Elusimicrobiaceae bacterium]